MKRIFTYTSICASWLMIPLSLFGGVSQDNVVHRMQRDFGTIENVFQAKYGPLYWKQTSLNWDLAREIDNARTSISAAPSPTLLVYRLALKQFLSTMKDYHVSASFYSTESSSLPFTVAGAEGRYFITQLWYDPTNSSLQRLNIGDEVVAFDKKLIKDVIMDLRNSDGEHSNPETDERLAQLSLTRRSAAAGFVVPTGQVAVTLRKANSTTTVDLPFTWTYKPDQLHTPSLHALSPEEETHEDDYCCLDNRLMQHDHELFLTQQFKKSDERVSEESKDEEVTNVSAHVQFDNVDMAVPAVDFNEIGGRNSFLPQLGQVVWQTPDSNSFNAYLFQTASGKVVGYVRIPSYEHGTAAKVQEFAQLMGFFQSANTSGLIVDQLNNPGGAFFYFYALASHLTNKPLVAAKHHLTLTQGDFVEANQAVDQLSKVTTDAAAKAALGTDITGYPVNAALAAQMLAYNSFIVKQWNSGNTFTDAFPLFGITALPPATSLTYTKPIIVLVNGLDFSCGDFFPALLQDNQRALLFGSRTAGAGGFIAEMKYSNPFGTSAIQYTASIAERYTNKPIENLGVTPDVVYNITADDLQNNYRGYVNALMSTLESYLQRPKT